ncbi:hypothetical protein JAAARDRAFT_126894 [Jaapia argillacea MUCL 33604]|uniref:Kinetochore protein NDC80 n=1 Tax=Jaapia argillacea MUCL 33604 TaxID=933084 RepID=A0A067PXW9_9AGAM|nr:hypothetical protein JAAARDRAFT_126894 [Jaapia argillacea MUCL 33604]
MADPRRRSVLQHAEMFSNARSGIPMPPSAMKKSTNNMRMSMAGPAMRGPYPPPGTNPRQSMYRSQNLNPLLQSASKPPIGRTPLKGNARRGSMWNGGGGAGAGPSSSQPSKDQRPLRDKGFQNKIRQEIVTWLQDYGFEISEAALKSITGKDYRAIFEFLIGQLDENYPFDPDKRMEEQFIQALRSVAYPFVSTMDPKWLAAPASMHCWPALLGVLYWLVEMAKAKESYLSSAHPSLQKIEDVPEQFDLEDHYQAISFEYYTKGYHLYLSGQDVFPDLDRMVEDFYNRKNASILEEVEKQREELRALQNEFEEMENSAPPLEKLKEQIKNVKIDEKKFSDLVRHCEQRKISLEKFIEAEKARLVAEEENLQNLRAEEIRLLDIVKVQNLSPDEVIKMNTEHQTLSRSIEEFRKRISETRKIIGDLEVTVARRVSSTEDAIDAYTNLLATLSLFPPLPHPLPSTIDLRVELNPAASDPKNLLVGEDVRSVIKPTLGRVAMMKKEERAGVEKERIGVENELDQILVECENLEEEIGEVEKQVVGLVDEADSIREAAQHEAMISGGEASRLQENLAQAKAAAMASGVGVKSRLQTLQIAYQEQMERVNRLKEDTIRAILKNCNDIGAFKKEVENSLIYLKDYAEAN